MIVTEGSAFYRLANVSRTPGEQFKTVFVDKNATTHEFTARRRSDRQVEYGVPSSHITASFLPGQVKLVSGDRVVQEQTLSLTAPVAPGPGGSGEPGEAGRAGTGFINFSFVGALSVKSFDLPWYAPRDITLKNVRASVGETPIGSAVIVDVNKNGSTIFANQNNRPTIASGETTAPVQVDVALVEGDYITIDVDQVGSSFPGTSLVIQVEAE